MPPVALFIRETSSAAVEHWVMFWTNRYAPLVCKQGRHDRSKLAADVRPGVSGSVARPCQDNLPALHSILSTIYSTVMFSARLSAAGEIWRGAPLTSSSHLGMSNIFSTATVFKVSQATLPSCIMVCLFGMAAKFTILQRAPGFGHTNIEFC